MSADCTFVPDPAWPTILELAIERWGQPNQKLSSRDDIRFGDKGSKSVKPSALIWKDHESGDGGGYVEMWRLARRGAPLPPRKTASPKPKPGNGHGGKVPPWENIGVVYHYQDAHGDLVLDVVRTRTGQPRFLQRAPDPGSRSGWKWSVKDVPNHDRLLYRLPELRASGDEIVWIAEGEKDADRLHDVGLTATCNIGGAGKWRHEYAEEFRGKHCVILPDNDQAGRDHAATVAGSLHAVASSVKVLLLPGLPAKGDISDWLDCGGTIDDLRRISEETPDYQPVPDDEPPPEWEAQHPANEEDGTTPTRRRTINILALVRHVRARTAWNGTLRFNMLTENYEICPPFPPHDGAKGPPRPLHDPHDVLLACMYFQANGFAKAGKGVVWDALSAVAHEHAYHPVRDYLDALQWDQTERVASLFHRYFKAELPPENEPAERDHHIAYLEHISIGFMVGAVARAMDPGCKHDHVPVIVGRDQGLLKSSGIRALCHDPAWFTDNIPPDISERDTKESLVGKWIIELAEIPHVRRDAERLKAFLSSQVDRYRAAYGRASQDHPRQSAFIGTSNDLEFVDVTGNRRFWPFRSAGQINIHAIEHDRDQLWAEALVLYRQGVRWWLPPNIEQIARARQDEFLESDVWEKVIAEWLAAHPGPFTMDNLFAKDTGITPYRDIVATPKADEMRAARCLIRLGWHKSQCTLNGKRAVWWHPR
jgi:hypothetical protein